MKNIIFLLLLFLPFYHASSCAHGITDSCSNYDTPVVQEKLHTIGFSKEKLLVAYIKQGFHEGMGSYYWELNILDSSNNIIKRIDQIVGTKSQDQPPHEFIRNIEGTLHNYGITLERVLEVSSFPSKISESLIDAYLFIGNIENNEGIVTTSLGLYMADSDFNFKKIGETNEVNFFGHKKKYDYRVAGFVRDPSSTNIAMIVTYKTKENEASDLICTFKLFATAMQIPDLEQVQRSSFATGVVEQFPRKADTYLSQGNEYWELKDFVYAKKAYQAYVELMKVSNKADLIPDKIIERADLQH